MASEYTTYYNLDLYTDNDKPNLRDQYNGAMRKIDAQLNTQNNNTNIAVESANQAKQNTTALKAVVDTNTTNIAKNAADIKANSQSIIKLQEEDVKLNDKINDTTNNITDAVNSHFPIKTGDIQAGAITRDKMDAQTLESLLRGTTIQHFDSLDGLANNEGMRVPSGCSMSGFYLPELTMLVINQFNIGLDAPDINDVISMDSGFQLPSYIPHITKANIPLGTSLIIWNASTNFNTFTSLAVNSNGGIGPASAITGANAANMGGAGVAFLRAYGVN